MSNNLVLVEDTDISPSEVFMDGKSITEIQLMEDCDAHIAEMRRTGDTTYVEQAIVNLGGVQNLAGRAKIKMIYEWSVFWMEKNPNGNFAEMYTQKHGGEPSEVQKHCVIGELLASVEVPDEVKRQPSKLLLAPARALQSGYDFTDDDWEEISLAVKESQVSAVVHRVKGTEKRAGSLDLVVEPDGSIFAWEDGVRVFVGSLNFADRDDPEFDETGKKILTKATSRIINNSGMRTK
jgi:hypothetical protein